MSAEPAARDPRAPDRRPLRARIALHLTVGWAYVVQNAKTRLAYRGDFLVHLLAAALTEIGGLAMVWVMFRQTDNLRGWTGAQVLFLYGFSILPRSLFGLVAVSFYRFSEMYLVEGQFDRILLRPVNALFQVVMEAFDFDSLGDFLLGTAIVCVAWHAMGHPAASAWLVPLFLLMIVSAAAVIFGIFLALTALSFWMTDRVGILPPVYNFMTFARYPLPIYHPWIRFLLSFILPFGFAAFYPATLFMGGGEEYTLHFWLTPLVGLIVLVIGYQVWRLGMRKYESTGT